MNCNQPGSMGFPKQEHLLGKVGCHSLLQGIFPTQGSNPVLPYSRQILYHLSHQGNQSVRIPTKQIRTNTSHSSTLEPTNQILAEKAKWRTWVAGCLLLLWKQGSRRNTSERIPQERVGSGWVKERCEWKNLKPVYFLVFFWAITLHFFNFKDFRYGAGIRMPKADVI